MRKVNKWYVDSPRAEKNLKDWLEHQILPPNTYSHGDAFLEVIEEDGRLKAAIAHKSEKDVDQLVKEVTDKYGILEPLTDNHCSVFSYPWKRTIVILENQDRDYVYKIGEPEKESLTKYDMNLHPFDYGPKRQGYGRFPYSSPLKAEYIKNTDKGFYDSSLGCKQLNEWLCAPDNKTITKSKLANATKVGSYANENNHYEIYQNDSEPMTIFTVYNELAIGACIGFLDGENIELNNAHLREHPFYPIFYTIVDHLLKDYVEVKSPTDILWDYPKFWYDGENETNYTKENITDTWLYFNYIKGVET